MHGYLNKSDPNLVCVTRATGVCRHNIAVVIKAKAATLSWTRSYFHKTTPCSAGKWIDHIPWAIKKQWSRSQQFPEPSLCGQHRFIVWFMGIETWYNLMDGEAKRNVNGVLNVQNIRVLYNFVRHIFVFGKKMLDRNNIADCDIILLSNPSIK